MTAQEKINDFILSRLLHQMGCPKWFKVNKKCECGLDEIRELIITTHSADLLAKKGGI